MKSVTKLKEKCVNIFKTPGRQTQDIAGHPEYRAESGLRERERESVILFSQCYKSRHLSINKSENGRMVFLKFHTIIIGVSFVFQTIWMFIFHSLGFSLSTT